MRVTEPPTFNAIADALTERLVTVGVDEVVAVGEVGDEFPPQVAVTTAAMTVPVKPARLDFTTRALLMTMLAKVGILPLAGGGLQCRVRRSRRGAVSVPYSARRLIAVSRRRAAARLGILLAYSPQRGRVCPMFSGVFLVSALRCERGALPAELAALIPRGTALYPVFSGVFDLTLDVTG